MLSLYEKRNADFYYRDDRDGSVKLGCNPHLHRHIELAYMIDGSTVGYADSAVCHILPGDIFIAFPNQIHRFVSSGPEKYMLFIVNPELIPEFSEVLTTALPVNNLLRAADCPPELVGLLRGLADISRSPGENQELILHGYLLAFFGLLLRVLPLHGIRAGDTRVLRTVIDYCARNYSRPLSLALLENELHVSRYYISHLFGDKLNVGFNDYVNSLRVSNACRLLRQSELSVTEISERVGFSTLRTFNRAFAKYIGVPPSEYKKLNSTDLYAVSVPM